LDYSRTVSRGVGLNRLREGHGASLPRMTTLRNDVLFDAISAQSQLNERMARPVCKLDVEVI
jgi:hypothetical protein